MLYKSSKTLRLLLPLLAVCSLGTTGWSSTTVINLADSFSTTQGANGLYYEDYADNRSSNMTTGGGENISLLPYNADVNYEAGSGLMTSGPNMSLNVFPYVMLDQNTNTVLLHPESGWQWDWANPNWHGQSQGAAISLLTGGGIWHITGAFARANRDFGVGDGVDVSIFTGTAADNPLFSANIGSYNSFSGSDFFGGTGVASFDFTVDLSAGEALRFAVFSGPQGTDMTGDVTALQFTAVQQVPEPGVVALLPLGLALLGAARLRRSKR